MPNEEKKIKLPKLSLKFRLKPNSYESKIIHQLVTNSRALYNSTLYLINKVLNKDDQNFIENFKKFIDNCNKKKKERFENRKKNNIKNKSKTYKPYSYDLSEATVSLYLSENCPNYNYMAAQISQQIIKKAYSGFISYFKLLKSDKMKNKVINKPNYLKKRDVYNVIFQNNSFSINDDIMYLSLGKYIQQNFSEICHDENIIPITKNKMLYIHNHNPCILTKDKLIEIEILLEIIKQNFIKTFRDNYIEKFNEDTIRYICKEIFKIINDKQNLKNKIIIDLTNYINNNIPEIQISQNIIKKIIKDSIILHQKNELKLDKKEIGQLIKKFYYRIVKTNNYIDKNTKSIIEGSYIKIPLYNKLKTICNNEKVVEVEIVPVYRHFQYEIIIKYINTKPQIKYIEPDFTKKFKIINNNDNKNKNSENPLAIDLGVVNFVTAISLTSKPFIISGGPIKSINKYYNNMISEVQSNIDLIKNKKKKLIKENNKDNTTKRKLSQYNKFKLFKLQKLRYAYYYKRQNKIKNYMHQISKMIVDYCKKFNITIVIVGKIKEWKKGINMGNFNQTFHQIPYNMFLKMLKYKLNNIGIKYNEINEAYTSKVDSLLGEKVNKSDDYKGFRFKRGLYVSIIKSKILNADINGALNILRKYYNHMSARILVNKNLNPIKIPFKIIMGTVKGNALNGDPIKAQW